MPKEVIHEYGAGKRHRIVILEDTGERSQGQWCVYEKLAHHRGYVASTAYHEGLLPVGVFRINPIPHGVLQESEDTS